MNKINQVIIAGVVLVASTVGVQAGGPNFDGINVLGNSYVAQNAPAHYQGSFQASYNASWGNGYNYYNAGGAVNSSWCSTPQMYDWMYNRSYYNNSSQNYWGRYYYGDTSSYSRETWTYQRETYNTGYQGGYRTQPVRSYPVVNNYYYPTYPYYSHAAAHGAGLADGIAHAVNPRNDVERAGGIVSAIGNGLLLAGAFRR